MELTLNGDRRSADVDPRMLLVEALRDAFGAALASGGMQPPQRATTTPRAVHAVGVSERP